MIAALRFAELASRMAPRHLRAPAAWPMGRSLWPGRRRSVHLPCTVIKCSIHRLRSALEVLHALASYASVTSASCFGLPVYAACPTRTMPIAFHWNWLLCGGACFCAQVGQRLSLRPDWASESAASGMACKVFAACLDIAIVHERPETNGNCADAWALAFPVCRSPHLLRRAAASSVPVLCHRRCNGRSTRPCSALPSFMQSPSIDQIGQPLRRAANAIRRHRGEQSSSSPPPSDASDDGGRDMESNP